MRIKLRDAEFDLENLNNLQLLQHLNIDFKEANLDFNFSEFNDMLNFRDANYNIEMEENKLLKVDQNAFDHFNEFSIERVKKILLLSAFINYVELTEILLYILHLSR